MELDEFRAVARRAGSTSTTTTSPPTTPGRGRWTSRWPTSSKVKRLTYDAGWMRWGWPERVGGLGGSTLLRAYLGEALTARDLVEPGIYSMTEVLAPTMIDYAAPELAATMVPRLLRGDETWCQGFSEPGTGSNLASLSCRATRTDDGWRVTGPEGLDEPRPVRRSAASCSPGRARRSRPTGASPPSSSTWTRPGITVRPIETMHGAPEFSEVFFDDVVVPFDRTLGDEGQGWSVAMDLLPFERSTALWHRAAFLHRRLQQLLDAAPAGALDPGRGRRGDPDPLRVPGPLPGHPAPAARRRAARAGDLDRQGPAWPRPSRPCSTSSPTASPPT